MPFIQRIVEPVRVSHGAIDRSIQNELECVTNNSLANIIRQLSSLSQHAEDMFSDLYRETTAFFHRATTLNERVEHLRVQVTMLNPTEEEVSLQDIHLRKPYQSSKLHDQQVVARDTIPKAIQDLYNKCEKPPALDKLNKYREDDKDCMKFYTDPSYFFELWYTQIQNDITKKRQELKEKRGKRDRTQRPKKHEVTPKKIVTKKEKFADKAQGLELRPGYQAPDIRVGGQKPIPEGYTRHSTDLPADARKQSIKVSKDSINNVPNNHISNEPPIQNGPYNVHPEYQSQQDPPYQSPQGQRQSQRMTPQAQNHPSHMRQSVSGQVPGRPNVAPPPPPPGGAGYVMNGDMMRGDRSGSLTPGRGSMPPPPPPPLVTQELPGHHLHYGSPRGGDQGLPPPPPPPLPDFPESPPPPSPPPILQANMSPININSRMSPGGQYHQNQRQMSPAPPPPPPPPPPGPMFLNNNVYKHTQSDNTSISSDISEVSSQASVEPTPPPQPKLTARSALLEEIKLGNKKLNKTEVQKRDTTPRDRFDVHAVMTKAFDMRRKAMEDSESEEEDEDDGESLGLVSRHILHKYFYSIELGEVHGKHCQGKPKRVSTGAIPEFRTQRDS
ncbi:actin-binding protein WASF3-like [Dreissena polymorpha]|uniref:Wiskott-Aldrich syndrome protein family member n=1 Tax=Dreissena polymorpha TaxID=45954 RepID=A0A9D4HNB3_DREPO|nr:actin-binding protein WASF3-like [Dreissena polymorpha]KAH3724870.1 hypothetical protein DPMN_050697 [Dreissena polymorpha]